MIGLVVRRVGSLAAMLIGVSALSFLLLELAPGNYFTELRLDQRLSVEAATRLKARYGLDQSLPARYAAFLKSAIRGDLGHSFAYDEPVLGLLAPRAGQTLLVTVSALVISWALALGAGIAAARRADGIFDRVVLGATALLSAVPTLVVALGLLVLAAKTGWLPLGGMPWAGALGGPWDTFREVAWHLVQPVAVVAASAAPFLARQVRSAWITASDEPFLRAARARGLGEMRLALHTLRAASPVLLSLLGLTLGGLLSSSMVAEVVSGWPGLGPLLLEAILAHDVHVIVGGAVLGAAMLGVGQLLADVAQFAVDPRRRREPAL